MNNRTSCRAKRLGRHGRIAMVLAATVLTSMAQTIGYAAAASEDEVRATFERFVTAQNAHDVKAVESLLLASPDFLWITRGTPVWGPEVALTRFAALYAGTWRLDPETSALKIIMLGDGAAQIFVPITFAIGAPGQSAQQTKFLMNQVLIRTSAGWKVSSILPIPLPAQ